MKVYAAQFCDCIFESQFCTISVHSTKLGAYKEVRKSKLENWPRRFGPLESIEMWSFMRWRIKEYEVQTP